ncbi:sulfotransferase [Ilyomonas limi]|uniref:Sulfotransferase n=1 Tax=Ilyomonas limi TaxID=2575867 RepID=A0A4U3L107_9BACT|nr:sulfotransferase [Ilyomonas limi]TKK68530.1 sulfotransferase [Ilyomonas limi]
MKYEELLRKPIIIFGTGRSGTTIISDILFQHEDLAWHNNFQELVPWTPAVNLLRRAFDNKWWRKIGMNTQNNKSVLNWIAFRPIERYNFWEKITGPRIDFSRGFLLDTTATEKERKYMRGFFAKMVKYQKRKRLAFKITGPSRMEYMMSIFPDAVFINVQREPLGTVRSWLEVNFWQDKGKTQLWWTGAYSPQEEAEAERLATEPALITAFQYKKLSETTAYEIEKMKPEIYEVHYEDFIKNPKAFIHDLMGKLQLQPSKLVEDYMARVPIRNTKNSEERKSYFTEEQKRKILEIVGDNNVIA